MIKISIFALILLKLFAIAPAFAQVRFKGDMETIDPSRHFPVGWTFPKSMTDEYSFTLDSTVKQQGRYSVSMANTKKDGNYASMGFGFPGRLTGRQIELRGYIKRENVTGWTGFWLRIDGTQAFENSQNANIKGTADWTEFSVKLPYDDEHATNIAGGVLLSGKGKIWVDNVQLFMDGKPIDQAVPKQIILAKAEQDTAFSKGSGIGRMALSAVQQHNLMILGQVWGFVKYHHFAVAKGDVNMDAELFRVMPAVLKATDNAALSKILEEWVDKLGLAKPCSTCKVFNGTNASLMPDYGHVFDNKILSASLISKLTDILNARNDKKYYLSFTPGVGNPVFEHEKAYAGMAYPDAGYRLLCLFRYWSMVQYFYPDRNIIGDWNRVLPDFIPQFMNDANAQEYAVTTLKMICLLHDTHANLWGYNQPLEDYRGKYITPFQAKFIQGKLAVTAYYRDTFAVKQKLKIGDVITAINGVPVATLIQRYLPLTAASNYETQLRDMPERYLLRSNNQHYKLQVSDGNSEKTVAIDGMPYAHIDMEGLSAAEREKHNFHVIDNQIGYVYPGHYRNAELPAIKKVFAGTKGIIIDMRCYPSEFMPFTFVPYIKSGNAPFVKFTAGNIIAPGLMETTTPLTTPSLGEYKGKVVVIVNAVTQSQAEYTTMAFQSSPNVTVIGSTTAGADGNVSQIFLPGGISTMFSGLGVLYPDGTNAQRKGVRVDEHIEPTIAGIKAGKDELLDRAVQIINGLNVKSPVGKR